MYYIIINDQQQGPFSLEELEARGLCPDSMVWRAGMSDWMPARNVDELRDYFVRQQDERRQNINRQNPFMQQPNHFSQQQNTYQQHFRHFDTNPTNWQPWAIVCTALGIFSCIGLVLGIIAISNSSKANKAYVTGDMTRAAAHNNTAKNCSIIGLIFDALGLIINISFFL